MSFTRLSIDLTIVSLAIFGAILLSALIWILIRKRRQRVWLPTLRLIRFESSPLPKLRIVRPPLVYFLCFLCCALAMLFLSVKPSETKYQETSKKDQRTHIFIDLSPSTQVYKKSQWKDLITEIYNHYSSYGAVSFSSSRSLEVTTLSSLQDVLNYVEQLTIHRYGTKLGKVLHRQLEKEGAIDRLVVVTDNDKNTWSDFNWQLLANKVEVLHAYPGSPVEKDNVFIDKIEKTGSPGDTNLSWRLALSRNFDNRKSSGSVLLQVGSETIRTLSWEMPEGEMLINIEVTLPRKILEQKGMVFDEDPLVWRLVALGADVLQEDNLFRTYVRANRQDVLLVANPQGEMFLDDPAHHLKTALEVLGFRVHRRDRIQDENSYLNMPLWILWGGQEQISEYCPTIYGKKRLQNTPGNENMLGKSKLPVVWLIPSSFTASYENLCHCYSRLIEDSSVAEKRPEYCRDLETRDQYISVLRSVGAQQVGGSIDNITESWAWHRKRPDRNSEVLAFTIPFRPSKRVGISHDMIPSLMKTFLQLSQLVAAKGEAKVGGWPRVNDGTPESAPTDSNVPRGESLMLEISESSLPVSWHKSSFLENQYKSGTKEESDPRTWIQLCFWLVVAFLVLEACWIFGKRLIHVGRGRREWLLLLLLLGWGAPSRSDAAVSLNLVGFDYRQSWGSTLARDVAGRTSIEMDENLQISSEIGSENFAAAWMWLKSASYLYDNTKLRTDVSNWIKRGGFLIIENLDPVEDLKRIQLPGVSGKWQAIPPDHELMRSFHLLDSLPKCKDNIWLGYHFDGRLAIVGTPFSLLDTLIKGSHRNDCDHDINRERATRIFVNLLMVALATDYKKDQIHLPEILKRLR